MRKLLSVKWLVKVCEGLVLVCLLLGAHIAAAEPIVNVDSTKLISQQIDLLKDRFTQAQNQFILLQRQSNDGLAGESRNQVALDVSVAKSNLDSLNIEISESQQTINYLEQDIQEIENQLNVFSVFGVKIAPTEKLNLNGLQTELNYQKNLLQLEKTRVVYLTQLQKIADNTLQLQKTRFMQVNVLLKAHTILQMKAQQAQAEVVFQQQQSDWLRRLNTFYSQLHQIETAKTKDKHAYASVQREIFYANENLNFTYLQMLIMRYQDELEQLNVTISHATSITLLNKTSEQVQRLSKQLDRVEDLLKGRIDILERHKTFLAPEPAVENAATKADLLRLAQLENQYKTLTQNIMALEQNLQNFRVNLDKELQMELSARQGLPGWNAKAWLNLGAEIWMAATLTFQMTKNLAYTVGGALAGWSYMAILLVALLEIGLVLLFAFVNKFLIFIMAGMAEHELGRINLRRLCIQVLRRNLIDIFVIGNLIALFSFCNIPTQSGGFVIDLALVWWFFKTVIALARGCLVETTHDSAGRDVKLYHRLKWSFLIGGVITALTVLAHQLPVVYEIKDLFDRLFLSFLLVVSIFLLRSWEILPNLILHHIDENRLYLKKIVCLLGLLVPLILLINTAIGLFGFVNLVLTVSWYESIFVLVLVGYLVVRGLLNEGMLSLSNLVIQHVNNGWLWTEVFLKPLDKVARISLVLAAWVVLFVCYGWNHQSVVMIELSKLLHYHIVELFNTSITFLGIIEVGVIISVLFWAARWTREFAFRLMVTRTPDKGLCNSMAIFSQYAVIVIGIFACLRVLGIDLRALAVVAGAFAFGVGLGLRDLFNNFACGFLLLIERPIRVGDIVSIDAYEGEVIQIGGRAVTVRTWDHMDVLVPNTEIFSKSFTNWTGKDHVVRSVITIKINRADNPHTIQAIIYQVLTAHKEILTEPAPEVFLKELSDSLMEFEVRYFINLRQIKSRIALRSEVLLAIWETFEKHGIQPPYPHHEVLVRSVTTSLSEKHLVPITVE